jgi:hypothetical protein
MRPTLSGNIVFVFSDPGGAKPCLALIELNNLSNKIAVSDRNYSFYEGFKTKVKIIDHDFEEFIEEINPELIFTGTSYTSNIEQQFIKIAKKKKINCYSFVDHWTSISKRFIDSKGVMILPDKVWVIDERASRIAVQEGIDDAKIIISGNPYHDWLRNWTPSVNKETFLKEVGIQNKKILVYAPDPLSNVNGTEVYGFDEFSATSELVELFDNHPEELNQWIVLVKAHPNQDRNILYKIIEKHAAFSLLPEEIDANTLIYYSDVVMGFFSSFLIEASVMQKPVLRYIVKKFKYDPIAELKIGTIVNKYSIISMLIKHLEEYK